MPGKGGHFTEEAKKRLSELRKVLCNTPEWKEQQRLLQTGKKHKPHTPEHCAKLSAALKGRKMPRKLRRKLSDAISGEKNACWRGGRSFGKYCHKFNREFKARVRAFFNYQCIECGSIVISGLHVHHVNNQKKACCNTEIEPLFVPLCPSCHPKTLSKKIDWEARYTNWIKSYYLGKCYFTRDEYDSFFLVPGGDI